MVFRIRRQLLSYIHEFAFTRLNGPVVASQTDIDPISKEQPLVRTYMGIVTIHAGGCLCDRRMLYNRRFLVSENTFMAFRTKAGDGRSQFEALL